jgi:signal transduction histidine kinase
VELHGGTIEVSSEENRGTRVTIRIPERPVGATDESAWLAGGGQAA